MTDEGAAPDGIPTRLRSVVLARVLVDEFVRAGMEHVVLCPGSRSAPLAYAVLAAAERGRLELHVRIDERSAGFTALGLAKASGRPVAVVTTSGTAVANLAPAVLEAWHNGIALVVVSADRPTELRGTGANQTTNQTALYGAFAHFFEVASSQGGASPCAMWRSGACRALAAALDGPVQLNVALDLPLVAADDATDGLGDPAADGRANGQPWTSVLRTESAASVPAPQRSVFATPRRTVVVAGDAAPAVGAATVALAAHHGWPVFAEPSSNARVEPTAIRLYRLLIAAAEGPTADLTRSIERVVVVGHPTLSRPVSQLLARTDIEVIVVGRRPWTDVAGTAALVLPEVPGTAAVQAAAPEDSADEDGWLDAWRGLDARLADALTDGPELTGPAVAALVDAAATAHRAALVVGSSSPVRDLDLAPVRAVAGAPVLANRGLGGIDGVVSTAVGVALAVGPVVSLMGDLTFLHDANGILIGPCERRPDLRIVVVNDNGGAIFHTLEPGAPAHADSFERLFGTPHDADLGLRCAATGVRHRRVDDAGELARVLAEPIEGLDVVEVPIDRLMRRAGEDESRRVASLLD